MLTLFKIAEATGGEIIGDGEIEITAINSLEKAGASSLSFYSDTRQEKFLMASQAAAVLLKQEHVGLFSGNKVVVENPYLAYARISQYFRPKYASNGEINPTALIASDANVADDVSIGAYSVIAEGANIGESVSIGRHVCIGENVTIGAQTHIEDNVVIYPGSRIGERCCLSSGVVIGASGFGYAPNGDQWEKIEQLGYVEVGNDVDIGANTTIDRGALDKTLIGNGVKLDNQIQIAHNVHIGDYTVMAGCSAVAGSARIGRRCKFGGRVSILGHLHIVDDVTVYSNSFVANSIKQPGEYASMIPVQKAGLWRKTVANIHRLDKLAKKLKNIGDNK